MAAAGNFRARSSPVSALLLVSMFMGCARLLGFVDPGPVAQTTKDATADGAFGSSVPDLGDGNETLPVPDPWFGCGGHIGLVCFPTDDPTREVLREWDDFGAGDLSFH